MTTWLVLQIILVLVVAGILLAAYLDWRRGRSPLRILASIALSFVPFGSTIHAVMIGRKMTSMKKCPQCGEQVHVRTEICPSCRCRFEPAVR